MRLDDITDSAASAWRSAGAYVSDLTTPTLRLGVTGLARAGKTVFITALVQNLIAGSRLPLFEPIARGRVQRAYLEPQPDDKIPRFAYEDHLAALYGDPPTWPSSTRSISQLRVTIDYEPESLLRRTLGTSRLHIDIVDYPGEWLLDLPLLEIGYREWSQRTMERVRRFGTDQAKAWLDFAATLDPAAPADERAAIKGAELFRDFLRTSRGEGNTLSLLAPGRFLLPGDLEGTPALTFMPLDVTGEGATPRGSLWSMMERRYASYVQHVVQPFFRDHFARLDRQVVLVDALSALNAGPAATAELERTLAEVLACFRVGGNGWLSSWFSRRIDRMLFAATKADHLHHANHDRLEAVLGQLTADAMQRAQFAGAEIKTVALAAVRATREAETRQGGETLPLIVGVPLPGERFGDTIYDGLKEIAVFPGDVPSPARTGDGQSHSTTSGLPHVRFLRFRPPKPAASTSAQDPRTAAPLPHIRLDRALQFLIGDRLA